MRPYQVNEEKWHAFPCETQLHNIAAELARSTDAALHGDDSLADEARERAISLIDSSLRDPQWSDKSFLYELRDAVAALYARVSHPALDRFIARQLLAIDLRA